MQRFGRKAVYIVIGDGVEEEQGAKKVLPPRSSQGASPSSVEPVSFPGSLVAGPLPLRNRRSILSHFLLHIPLRAFGCRPWWPCVVSGTTAQEPRDPPSGQAGGGAGARVCVLFNTH